MKYIELEIEHINLEATFFNGQCFRWNRCSKDSYIGIINSKVYEIKNVNKSIYRIYNANEDERAFFENYFDLQNNYIEIEYFLYNYDDILKKSILFGRGMHLLRQDIWETTISFILSIQKNIPSIRKTIESLCMRFGDEIKYKDKIFYSFPDVEKLKDVKCEEIMQSKCGFRARGVLDAARKVADREVDLNKLYLMSDRDAKYELKKIRGIGEKVADCILLFALSRYRSCPVDTWVKAGLDYFYNIEDKTEEGYRNFASVKWGENAGFAQQYLFHYLRYHYIQDKKGKNLIKREKNEVFQSII
jgi:N-glycosylase/DNA lyase